MEAIEELEMTIFEKAERSSLVNQARTILLRLLTVKFGSVPAPLVRQIEAINNASDLTLLSEQVVLALSLEDIHLPKAGQN